MVAAARAAAMVVYAVACRCRTAGVICMAASHLVHRWAIRMHAGLLFAFEVVEEDACPSRRNEAHSDADKWDDDGESRPGCAALHDGFSAVGFPDLLASLKCNLPGLHSNFPGTGRTCLGRLGQFPFVEFHQIIPLSCGRDTIWGQRV